MFVQTVYQAATAIKGYFTWHIVWETFTIFLDNHFVMLWDHMHIQQFHSNRDLEKTGCLTSEWCYYSVYGDSVVYP